MVSKERLRTVSPDHKSGVIMDRRLYEQVKKFILHVLDSHDEVTLNELLNYAPIQFHKELGENVGWFIYKVKLDLEARGLIKQRSIRNSRQSVTKKMSKKSRAEVHHSIFEVTATQIDVNKTVKDKFIALFGKQPLMIHSPGRINLIGEHTDYNNGFVMPAAIDKGIQFAIAPSKSKQSVIFSLKYNEYFTVDHSNITHVDTPVWANYLLGILHQMKSKGLNVSPFNCVFDGDLPLGSGLSSSAAMECGFAFAINELNQLNLSNLEMIHMAQWAEHNYVNVKCGIMDQFASIMSKEGYAVVLDCQSLTYNYFPIQLQGYVLVLCNSNVKHSLASSEYNTRREECEIGVRCLQSRYPSIKSLRDVTRKMLNENAELLPDKVFKRCQYVIEENGRVQKASKDLKNGFLKAFGKKMFQTHSGLSNLYEVSCPELDFLVSEAKKFKGVVGARMMGGGFGGCTINIVRENHLGEFIIQMKRKYKEQFVIELTTHVVKTGNGTSVIEIPAKRIVN